MVYGKNKRNALQVLKIPLILLPWEVVLDAWRVEILKPVMHFTIGKEQTKKVLLEKVESLLPSLQFYSYKRVLNI